MDLLWLFLSALISISIHEIAHGSSAVMRGFKVVSVRLGVGPAIVKWRVQGIDFVVGYPWTLFIGHVEANFTKNTPVGPRLFIASAGLIANAVIVVLSAIGYRYAHQWIGIFESFALVNVIIFVTNAIPFVIGKRGKTKILTDGGEIAAIVKELRTARNSSNSR